MGQASRTILVHAFDDRSKKGQPGFRLSGFGVDKDEVNCNKNEARPKMKRKDHHKIIFEIANESSLDLRFPKDADDAIWVATDDQHCPRSPCSNPEIKPQSVTADGECLTVFNLNSCPARFRFSLVFEDAASGQRHVHDPIWVNKNGGLE